MTTLQLIQSLQNETANDVAPDFNALSHEEKFYACMIQFIKGILWKSPRLLEKIQSGTALDKREIGKIRKWQDEFYKYVMQKLSGAA